jgi:hypothetical protein
MKLLDGDHVATIFGYTGGVGERKTPEMDYRDATAKGIASSTLAASHFLARFAAWGILLLYSPFRALGRVFVRHEREELSRDLAECAEYEPCGRSVQAGGVK